MPALACYGCRTFTCPTGATTFTITTPLDPLSSSQALIACEACYGTGQCRPGSYSGALFIGLTTDLYSKPTFGYNVYYVSGTSPVVYYSGGHVYNGVNPLAPYGYGFW